MTDDSQRTYVRESATQFLAEAFDSLRDDHVIPRAFDPFVRVGRDYFGDAIRALPEYPRLERQLNALYPGRFAGPENRVDAQSPSTYMFSLIEAAVARCSAGRDYAPESPAIAASIDELFAVLHSPTYEVVCCRVVSHLTTRDGRNSVEIGPVTVIPEADEFRALEGAIEREIPGASSAFNRERQIVFDRPHALLVAREIVDDVNPYAAVSRVSQKLERFLLHQRLLTAGTIRSFYEVRGTTKLVTHLAPSLVTFPGDRWLPSLVQRAVTVSPEDSRPSEAIGALIDETSALRGDGLLFASFDVALHKFHTSYRQDGALEILVDLGTALEAALGSDGDSNEGLTFRLRSRAAALLSADSDSGSAIFADIGHLYGLRSATVHGASLKQKKFDTSIAHISTVPESDPPGIAVARAIDRMRDLVRRAILARVSLAAGPEPLWPGTSKVVDTLLADDATREHWRDAWRQRLRDLGAPQAED